MNVYVRWLASALGCWGFKVDIFTRAHDADHTRIIDLDENTRVVHIKAGPIDAPKQDLLSYLPRFLSGLKRFQKQQCLE